jgi:hypothetical protein
VLDRAGIAASGTRLAYILMRAELDAVLCSGAPRGRQQTYASLDQRAPEAKTLDRDEALAELTSRYFRTRGPATLKDYTWWSSLTAVDARRGLDMARSELQQDIVDGRTYWFAEPASLATDTLDVVDLVQVYDECVISYSETRDLLDSPWASVAIPRERIPLMHAILLEGRLIGRWRPVSDRTSVVVETTLGRPLEKREKAALDMAVERFGRFMAKPAERQ